MGRRQRLQHRAGEALFRLVAGPEGEQQRVRIHGTPGPRWFERGTPITVVHGDAAMFVGGIRAVMMQSLHPVAMTAVAEHSGFRGDLWGRLARTSTFLATTTFGPEVHAQAAVDKVRMIHEHVTGTMPDGTPYVASDPHLLAWVHAAEVDSFLTAHQAYGQRRLTAAECDDYLAQTAVVARKLGVLDPPTSAAGLRAVLDDFRPELRATAEAREAMAYVRLEPPLSRGARAPYAVLWAAAIGLMPPWARTELELPSRPRLERRVVPAAGRAAVAGIRWALRPGAAAAARLEPQSVT
ncbi:MAG: oxygenase MpaB family protein [Nocardioidaceae bacterium]